MTDGVVKTDRHTTAYLEAGAPDAPVIVFVHGWPELSLSWRHQLPCFADLGFRAIAPDMRTRVCSMSARMWIARPLTWSSSR